MSYIRLLRIEPGRLAKRKPVPYPVALTRGPIAADCNNTVKKPQRSRPRDI